VNARRPAGIPRAAAAALAAVALLAHGAAATAAPPAPMRPQVYGGEGWHSSRGFFLGWNNPVPIPKVHCRVHDSLGWIVWGDRELGPEANSTWIEVPAAPDTYTAEVWYEDSSGVRGLAAEAKLRFDDVRPGPVRPAPDDLWIGRTGFPVAIHLGTPAYPRPLSGIGGYAVSIDASPGVDPCAAADRCTNAETDLRAGPDDSYRVDKLPEGTAYLNVVAVSGAGMKSTEPGTAVLRIDRTSPTVSLDGAPPGWTDRAPTLVATARDAGSGMWAGYGDLAPFTAIRVDGRAPVVATGDTVSITLFAEGVHTVSYYARDVAGNVDDGRTVDHQPNPQPATATVRIDRTPPRVSFANAQDPLEPESIRARVADDLSGPDLARGRIGVRRAGSGDPFAPLPATAPGNGELRAHWDSDSYPPGDYEFEAIGYDRAGNGTTSSRRGDGAAMVLSNPLKAPTAISVAFGGRSLTQWHCRRRRGRRRCRRQAIGQPELRPASRTVAYGRPILLSGRLRSGAGSPLGGRRPVRVIESFLVGGGPPATRTTTALTDSNGDFAFRLPPGPSREVSVVFDGSPTLARATARPLALNVRSVVRLRASAAVARIGGAPLVFRGRVDAAPGTIRPGGASVELQFRLPGRPWSEFRTLQTDRQGRFRYAYRFSDDDSRGARFQFRAYVPAQGGWPYEAAGSLPVLVTGA
jgi:hypothetical protein